MSPKPVVMINDGAIDEFVAAVMLADADEIDLRAIVMVDADCIGTVASEVMWKFNRVAGAGDTPIGLSGVRGLNAFPWSYRTDCIATNQLSMMAAEPSPDWLVPPCGDRLLGDLLDAAAAAGESITVLSTGPITPLTRAFAEPGKPNRADAVDQIIWMAGAVDVPGNLDPTTIPPLLTNAYAEWNLFWDPPGSQELLDLYAGPITLLPLDISDSLPVDTLLAALFEAGRTQPFARLCHQAYSLVKNEPFYRLWDTVTALYLLEPDLFAEPHIRPMRIETDPVGPQGALLEANDGKHLRLILDFAGGTEPVTKAISKRITSVA